MVTSGIYSIIGSTGLERWGGHVQASYLEQLQGERGRKTFRQMSLSDPVVGAVLYSITTYLRQMQRVIEPADQSDADLEAVEFIESCFDDMSTSWEDTLSEILTHLVYGWSYHELIYKLRKGESANPSQRSKHDDGRIGWRKLMLLSQHTLDEWEFDEDGGIQGMWQVAPPDYERVLVPIEKALLFRTTALHNNPEGLSILVNAYRPWYFKRQIEQIEAIGIERDLAGFPTIYAPWQWFGADAESNERRLLDQLTKVVTGIRRDNLEGVVIPSYVDEHGNKLIELELLSTGGTRQFNTDSIIGRYAQHIAMTILADWILLGHEQVGTQALSVTKVDIFELGLQATADAIADIFNSHAIPRLIRLNNFNVQPPRLKFSRSESVDLAVIGDFVSKLSAAGAIMFPDEELENHLRTAAGLPDVPEDYEERAEAKLNPIVPPELQGQQEESGGAPGSTPDTEDGEQLEDDLEEV